MAVLIVSSKIDAAQTTAMRLAARKRVQDAVQATMSQATVVRDLAAYDLSGAAQAAARYARLNNKNALVAQTWFLNDLGTKQVPNNTAIAIFGYEALTPSPKIDAIAFSLGPVVLAQFWLQAIYCDLYSAVGYFNPPVVFGPLQNIQINLLSEVAVGAAAESYALYGYVAEPSGNTVQPDQSNLV